MRLQCMHYFNVSVCFFLVSPFRCFFLHLSIASSSLLPSTSLPSYPLHPLMHPPPPLPFSVALLFIAMSSQGSAATKAFSCCHYNYSLHTHRHTHAHTCTLEECLCVCMHVRCVCVPVCAPACAVTHKRVSYFYLSPSLPPSPPLHRSPHLPATTIPLIPLCRRCLLPATFAMLSTGSISRAPTPLLSSRTPNSRAPRRPLRAFPSTPAVAKTLRAFTTRFLSPDNGTRSGVGTVAAARAGRSADDLKPACLHCGSVSFFFLLKNCPIRFVAGSLSQCCGPYLKRSVLSLPQRESWERSSRSRS